MLRVAARVPQPSNAKYPTEAGVGELRRVIYAYADYSEVGPSSPPSPPSSIHGYNATRYNSTMAFSISYRISDPRNSLTSGACTQLLDN